MLNLNHLKALRSVYSGPYLVSRCLLKHSTWTNGGWRQDVSGSKTAWASVRKSGLHFQKIYNPPLSQKRTCGKCCPNHLHLLLWCLLKTCDPSSRCLTEKKKKGWRLTFPVVAASLSILLRPSFVSSLSLLPSLPFTLSPWSGPSITNDSQTGSRARMRESSNFPSFALSLSPSFVAAFSPKKLPGSENQWDTGAITISTEPDESFIINFCSMKGTDLNIKQI